ncbi:FAD-dependent monooxygenase [Aurantiacibacter flavus]|uniref:FAD-dependent monooxygenase n=1 Tax=Aurantiacibacter flavus TaxID=3145232 RepID=A0ABV0CZE5_9SPHN
MRQVSVLVAGGGPVGLTLARDLARRGIDVMLVERNATTTRHPKMDNTNVRSMEMFSLAGLEDRLRAVAVPEDSPFDVSWVTSMTGYEVKRFPIPSPQTARALFRERNDGSQPYSPAMRVSQAEIEPVLRTALDQEELSEVRFNLGIVDCAEDDEGVTATLRHSETGETEQVRCKYLAGCDGGGSTVRESLGIKLAGQFNIMPRFMTHFRTDDHEARALLQRWGRTWHYQSNHGTLIAQNDIDTWTLHSRYPANAVDGADPKELVARFVGKPIAMEVQVANPWSPHLATAERAVSKRCILAGDAAHQYIPTGGYGMNTGIADAYGAAWVIAAMLQGFGGPKLLAGYERERVPVWNYNCSAARRHNDLRVEAANIYVSKEAALEDDGPAGEQARAAMTAELERIGNAEAESLGIEMGYHYQFTSPLVCKEAGAIVPFDPEAYTPHTVPGGRLPSVYLEDGRAVYALLGRWFTLLAFGNADTSAMEQVAARRGIPLEVLRIKDDNARAVYAADMLLVRPDQHVAWRGSAIDAQSSDKVLAMATGW